MTFTPTLDPSGGSGNGSDYLSLHGVSSGQSGLAVDGVKAVPNISTNGTPIHFEMNLGSGAKVELSLFSITGDLVYHSTSNQRAGVSRILWSLGNLSGNQVASGIYLYVLQASNGAESIKKTGKVVVLH